MNEAEIIEICREALWVIIKLGGPIMIAALVVGVAISLLQAVTQIQEATVAFVPKILVVFLVGLLMLPLMMSTLNTFTQGIAARIVQIVMRESDGRMLFLPDTLTARRGEQIRFQLRNNGEVDHEFVVGTVEENLKHMKEMEKNPDMEHDDPNAKRLKPKGTGEIVWQFTKAGGVNFACLIPGHFQAGMIGTITVG